MVLILILTLGPGLKTLNFCESEDSRFIFNIFRAATSMAEFDVLEAGHKDVQFQVPKSFLKILLPMLKDVAFEALELHFQHFSGLRPTMSNFKLWSSFSAFPSPWFKHVNWAVAKLPMSLMLFLFSVKHGFKKSQILMLTPLWQCLSILAPPVSLN